MELLKKIKYQIAFIFFLILLLTVYVNAYANDKADSPLSIPVIKNTVAPLLKIDGLEFKDLNKNGKLDPYEDWRLSPEERSEDLLSRMTIEEKVAQMIHLTLFEPQESWFSDLNVGFALVYTYLMEGPLQAAEATNEFQKLSESSRLGIPVIFSMDSVNGASWVHGATIFPDQLGLAATGDVNLVKQLADLQREEMLAIGVRMSLSPVADLATEPRWGRFQECFGEESSQAAGMVVAAIEGLHNGEELNPESVLACVKHFPGAGPQKEGKDGSPLVFDEDSLEMHLSVFKRAIEAGVAAIMPYGYSTVPFLGGDAIEKTAHESSAVMKGLLRDKLGFKGLIQTDWGMHHVVSALSGADVLGGAGPRQIQKLAEELPVEKVDESARRILNVKFKMGLFENPYVNPEKAVQVLGSEKNKTLALKAASKSLTLIKDKGVPALTDKNLIIAGKLAEDVEALSSGWKAPDSPGRSILQVLQEKAGADKVAYIADDTSRLDEIDCDNSIAIVVIGEETCTHEPAWGSKNLEFPAEQMELVRKLNSKGVPIVTVVLLGRPYVMTELVELSDAVIIAYRPGVSMGAEAIASALFGESPLDGKLPMQLPRSMEQVESQREDLSGDIDDPLFDRGFGLDVDSFGTVAE